MKTSDIFQDLQVNPAPWDPGCDPDAMVPCAEAIIAQNTAKALQYMEAESKKKVTPQKKKVTPKKKTR